MFQVRRVTCLSGGMDWTRGLESDLLLEASVREPGGRRFQTSCPTPGGRCRHFQSACKQFISIDQRPRGGGLRGAPQVRRNDGTDEPAGHRQSGLESDVCGPSDQLLPDVPGSWLFAPVREHFRRGSPAITSAPTSVFFEAMLFQHSGVIELLRRTYRVENEKRNAGKQGLALPFSPPDGRSTLKRP